MITRLQFTVTVMVIISVTVTVTDTLVDMTVVMVTVTVSVTVTVIFMVPDGIQHPAFSGSTDGESARISCNRLELDWHDGDHEEPN